MFHGGGLQGFIDDVHGAFFAVILHWVGALAFIAGIVLLVIFLAQRRGDPALADRAPVLAGVLLVGGIVLNLVGGFMRLWESDHPGLADIASSKWVQALAAKHAGLILGMGASVVLLAAATPAVRRRSAALATFLQPSRTEAMTFVAVLGIAAATIVGALATTVVLPVSPTAATAGFPELGAEELAWERVEAFNFTGTLTGNPVQPARAEHALVVPPGASAASFALTWSGPLAALSIELLDPSGAAVEAETEEAQGRVDAVLADPQAGTWTVIVSSERAASEAYRLEAQVASVVRAARHEQVAAVSAGGRAEFEVELPPGGRLRYDYYLASGSGVTFQVHSDDAPDVEAETTEPSATGSFTSAQGGHYGVLLTSTQEARAAVRLVGAFTLLAAPGAAAAEEMGDGHAHG